jgi:hypothetical protein
MSAHEAHSRARAHPRWIEDHEALGCQLCEPVAGSKATDKKATPSSKKAKPSKNKAAAFGWRNPRETCRYCGWSVCEGCHEGVLAIDRWLEDSAPHEIAWDANLREKKVCRKCFVYAGAEVQARQDAAANPGLRRTMSGPPRELLRPALPAVLPRARDQRAGRVGAGGAVQAPGRGLFGAGVIPRYEGVLFGAISGLFQVDLRPSLPS